MVVPRNKIITVIFFINERLGGRFSGHVFYEFHINRPSSIYSRFNEKRMGELSVAQLVRFVVVKPVHPGLSS